MATVSGVVFSITIVALALASSQYTSRVLRTFMRDRATQTVLGVFVGAHLYCLLVLLTIDERVTFLFVPSVAVLGAVLLAVMAIGFFIFFIHHISSSIQVAQICHAVTAETLQAIDHIYPEKLGDAQDLPAPAPPTDGWQSVPAQQLGYIQKIDADGLLRFAHTHQTRLHMVCSSGDFVFPEQTLAWLDFPEPLDKSMVTQFNSSVAIASNRTIEQDAGFGLRQLVDIALKALSAGVNDTTTAVTCIEHTTAILSHYASRRIPSATLHDDGTVRVIARMPVFSDFVTLSFAQILETASTNSEIMLRMLVSIESISARTNEPQRLITLRDWTTRIEEASQQHQRSKQATHAINHAVQRNRMLLSRASERI